MFVLTHNLGEKRKKKKEFLETVARHFKQGKAAQVVSSLLIRQEDSEQFQPKFSRGRCRSRGQRELFSLKSKCILKSYLWETLGDDV